MLVDYIAQLNVLPGKDGLDATAQGQVTVLHAVNDSDVHFSDVCVLVGKQKVVQANTSFLSLVQNQAIVF